MATLSIAAARLAGPIALALALAAPARAAAGCEDDAKRLCQNVPAGGSRVFVCLQTSWNKLSDDCRATMTDAQRMAREVALDCQGDVFAWCQGVVAGEGRVLTCLVTHADDLSSGCLDALAGIRQFQDACTGDVAAVCPGVQAGGGRIVACLLAQRQRLSSPCASFLSRR
jgi:hypothetical protein